MQKPPPDDPLVRQRLRIYRLTPSGGKWNEWDGTKKQKSDESRPGTATIPDVGNLPAERETAMTTRLQAWNRLAASLSADAIVLEIGGGPDPWPRSDILADSMPFDNAERHGDMVMDRPVIACDAHHLPFPDKSFDFVFCAQVLEHVEDPSRFLDELQRVGKAGYLETPRPVRELLFGWPFHRWLVDTRDDRLVIRPNNAPQVFGSFFHELQNPEWVHFVRMNHDLLNVCHRWEGRIRYEIEPVEPWKAATGTDKVLSGDALQSPPEPADPTWASVVTYGLGESGTRRLRDFLRRWMRVRRPRKTSAKSLDLDSLLVCPETHEKLVRDGSDYRNPRTGRRYPVIGGIPHLFLDEEASR